MWDEMPYVEGCLSFPGNPRTTKRYKYIEYTDSLIEDTRGEGAAVIYGPTRPKETTTKGSWEHDGKKDMYDRQILESVCIQHEIDHLYGLTILDREQQLQPVKRDKKIGRNELVTIKKGDAVKVLKYKKAFNLLNQGWVIK